MKVGVTRMAEPSPIFQEQLPVVKKRMLITRKSNENKKDQEKINSRNEFGSKLYSAKKRKTGLTANQNKHDQTKFTISPQILAVKTLTCSSCIFKIALLLLCLNTAASANSILHRLPALRSNDDILPTESPPSVNFIVRLRKRSLEGPRCYIPLKNLALLSSHAVSVARNGHTFKENEPRIPPKRNTQFLKKNEWPKFALEMHHRIKQIFCEIDVNPRVLRRKESNLITTIMAMIGTLQEEMNMLGIRNYNPDLSCPRHSTRPQSKRGVMTELNKMNKALNDLCRQGFLY